MGVLEDLRERIGYSKTEMSRAMGINLRTYYRWVEGKVTLDRLRIGLDNLSSYMSGGMNYTVEISIDCYLLGRDKERLN